MVVLETRGTRAEETGGLLIHGLARHWMRYMHNTVLQ
jgi:hypothetical protein